MTKIEWTEKSWNPMTGCTKVSTGCRNCYAEKMALRLQSMGQAKYKDGFRPTYHPDSNTEPFRYKKPTMFFVCSMSDLFHEDFPEAYIEDVFRVMEQAEQHTFQVLTKRAARMHLLMSTWFPLGVPSNIWLGVSIENQDFVERAEFLDLKATVRFISVEPLLGPIDFEGILEHHIDWVIVGAESGPGHRPMKERWVLDILGQCLVAEIPFFYKQKMFCGKKISMPELNGVVYDQMPVIP